MNRSIILLSTIFLASFATKAVKCQTSPQKTSRETNYELRGRIERYEDCWVYLAHGELPKANIKKDSVKVKNGEFLFTGAAEGIEACLIGVPAKDANGKTLPRAILYQGPFILTAGQLNVSKPIGKDNQLMVTGSHEQAVYNSYLNCIAEIDKKGVIIFSEMYRVKKINPKRFDQLTVAQDQLRSARKDSVGAVVLRSLNSPTTAYIIKKELIRSDIQLAERLYYSLENTVRESYFGKVLAKYFDSPLAIGKPAPSFRLKNVDGKMLSLENFKGKYILLDFWASWCAPCRVEHPNLIKTYRAFNSKGFNIVSISLDKKKDAWLKAIKDDNLQWTQLSDLKGSDSEIKKTYNIETIPTNFLLDTEGKIIGKNLLGKDLHDKLEKLLK